MTKTVKCQDCPKTMPRGDAYARSVAFELVFFCRPCWARRVRFAEIVRAVTSGLAA